MTTLAPGSMLAPYSVVNQIGAGGMGDVYKARDTRLNRDVALKVLRGHSMSADSRERFRREAETLANLQHPHICVLYDIGQQDGVSYLVMEYLVGETLAERLKKGPLPLDQALHYAVQISDALDKAHRKGFTHRDIKPANIMLTKDGAKLLDFGLAKLKQQNATPVQSTSDAPTAYPDSPTAEGTILGTLQYMAPEQVEGRIDDIDARSDIFSFGATLYEMLTGRKAFEGGSQASVLAKVLEYDPPAVSSVQSRSQPSGKLSPPALDRVVKRCLEKDPENRWQSARDLCQELQWIRESGAQPAASSVAEAPVLKKWKRRLAWSVFGLVVWVATAVGVWIVRTPAAPPVSRLTITLPPAQRLTALDQPAVVISPDGKNVVYVAVEGGIQQLFLRPLDSMESKPIRGTEGAVGPFFSPDGQSVGFFADEALKKIAVTGGGAIALATGVTNPGGGSWSDRGVLTFQPSTPAGLRQLSQEGAALQPLTKIAIGEIVHRWPEFLPNGDDVLFVTSPTSVAWNNGQIAVQARNGGRQNLLKGGARPRYSPTGHLLYAQSGTLMAAPFDSRRLALTGPAAPMIEGLMQSTATGSAQYSVSSTGTLVYLAGGLVASQSRLVWVSRTGEERPLPAPPHTYNFPRISPDGRSIAVAIAEQDVQIWVYDSMRDILTRLTSEGNANNTPVWSPDGMRIAFFSNRAGAGQNLFWQPADGSSGVERLTTSDFPHASNSFSRDGKLLAFTESTPDTRRDIWILNLSDRKAQPVLRTPHEDTAPAFSPDGKWLVYTSDELGHREVYVQPYPGPGPRTTISKDGGQEPLWNPKGGELFYRRGGKIMVVDVDTKSGFSAGKPRMLFDGPYLLTGGSLPNYSVSPDGQQFLMLKPVDPPVSVSSQINVVLNWFSELQQRAPVK